MPGWRLWPRVQERPRRRFTDGIDAGYRLFSAVFDIAMWGFIVALMATSSIRSVWWLVAILVFGVPLAGKLWFGIWSVLAWQREREWLRLQRLVQARRPPTPPPPPPSWRR